MAKQYSTAEASRLDKEIQKLTGAYSSARIRVGMELAIRLKEVSDNKLYLKLDERAYPTFARYIESLGVKYKTARELISLYESFVLVGGFTIEELLEVPYHKLTTIKPHLFRKEAGQYHTTKTKNEIKKWLSDAKSDMTIDDLAQKRREVEVGDHVCRFTEIRIRKCELCGLRERH